VTYSFLTRHRRRPNDPHFAHTMMMMKSACCFYAPFCGGLSHPNIKQHIQFKVMPILFIPSFSSTFKPFFSNAIMQALLLVIVVVKRYLSETN
jgi:hypothetical protein